MCDAQREMTLEEWVYRLPEIHKARREYEQLLVDVATIEIINIFISALSGQITDGRTINFDPRPVRNLLSRILVALSNTTPYLSQDVNVPVNPDWEHCQRCGKRYDAVWRAPDKLWKAVTGIKDGSGLFCPSCFTAIAQGKGISVYWDACESEAWDKVAPVAQDDCIERIISYVDEYINDQIDRVVLKSEIGLVLNDIFFSYLVPADLTDTLVEAAEKAVSVAEITGGKIGIHVVRELRAALAAYRGEK